MRSYALKMSVIWFAAMLSACESSQITAAKDVVSQTLNDPNSAQFRSLIKSTDGFVCGEVNAKNKFGGYAGFMWFLYTKDGELNMSPSSYDVNFYCRLTPDGRVAFQVAEEKERAERIAAEEKDKIARAIALEKENIERIAAEEKRLVEEKALAKSKLEKEVKELQEMCDQNISKSACALVSTVQKKLSDFK